MSAGSGVTHSEFNPSRDERVHLLQIWILPDAGGGAPRYAEKALGTAAKPNALTLLFSGKPRDGAIGIRADADVYVGKLDAGNRLAHEPARGRGIWLHVISGDVNVAGESLGPGDGAAIEDAEVLEIESRAPRSSCYSTCDEGRWAAARRRRHAIEAMPRIKPVSSCGSGSVATMIAPVPSEATRKKRRGRCR